MCILFVTGMKLGILNLVFLKLIFFVLNINAEWLELKIPPQEKEKGFKAILSQPCHVEVNRGHFLVHTLVCEEEPVGMLLRG